ncbi:hypothetical protein [Streptomyces scopuliridis]|uniref:hypothetical protein n=1 Tax=Streptomyces scopuliridis TaxID=452529 RepID=UPI0036B40603
MLIDVTAAALSSFSKEVMSVPMSNGRIASHTNEGRNKMRSIRPLSVGIAAVLGVSLLAIAPAASASGAGVQAAACATLYATAGFQGGSRSFSANDGNFDGNVWSNGRSMNDDTNAVKNRCGHTVTLWEDSGYYGDRHVMRANGEDSDLGNNGFSNRASSLSGF